MEDCKEIRDDEIDSKSKDIDFMIEETDICEFDFEDFKIINCEGAWFLEFADHVEHDDIIVIEDESNEILFEDDITIKGITVTLEMLECCKMALRENPF